MVAFFCPPPFMKAQVTPFDLSYIGVTTVASATTTASATVSLGAETPGRLIIMAVHNGSAAVLTGATINGVTATIAAQLSGTATAVAIVYAVVPAGESVTVTATWGASAANAYFGIWKVVGQLSSTPFATGVSTAGGDAARSLTINSPANGAIVAAAIGISNAPTWVGVASNYNANVGGSVRSNGASSMNLAALTAQTVSASSARALVAISVG